MRWLFLFFAALPCFSHAQWQLPLDVRNHRSASLAFLRLTPRSHIASPGETSLSYSLVMANEFRKGGLIDEDAETLRALFAFGKGLEGGNELFFELPVVARGSGIFDALIDWWHQHVINRTNPIRVSTPTGRSVIQFPGGGPFNNAIGLGDLTLGIARKVAPGAIVRIAAKLPTGNPDRLLGSGAIDVGAAADVRLSPAKRWTIDFNGGIVLQGPATDIDRTQRSVFFSAIALTFAHSSRDAWTVQLSSEQFPTKTGHPMLDKDHRVISFGYQRRLADGSVLQIYFSEDGDFLHFPGGPTLGPDVTFGLRFVQFR